MIHSTGANNPNINRYVPIGTKYSSNHWDKTGIAKCVHAFIGYSPEGGVDICQTLPWNFKGWHAGSASTNGEISCNNTHIGFECCEDNLQDPVYFRKVWDKAVELTAYLCDEFHLDPMKPGVVISHHEGHLLGRASNHGDIDHWFKAQTVTMDMFRVAVANKLKEGETVTQAQFNQMLEAAQSAKGKESPSAWAQDEEVIPRISREGISDGTRPQSFTTREEVFAMMLRLENRLTELFGKENAT